MLNIRQDTRSNAFYSQQVIKDRNLILLFNLIRIHGPISRAELARESGLSPATVTVLTEELIADQCVEEETLQEPRQKRGRRPIKLMINGARGYVFTLELLADDAILSLYDIRLNKITSARYPNRMLTSTDLPQIMYGIADSLRISRERILGIHILYPGLFDPQTRMLGFSTNIESGQLQPDLVPALQEQMPQVLVLLNNISTAIAYSVHAFHAPDAALPLLAMSIHEGIGTGLVTDDHSCLSVEAGHFLVRPGSALCKCGNRGCLEALCSAPMLIKRVSEQSSLSLPYDESYGSLSNDAAVMQIREAMENGREDVCSAVSNYIEDLSTAIVSISNLLGLKSFYLGGTIHLLGDRFLKLIEEQVSRRYNIVTSCGSLSIGLFDDDCEISRKAAVLLVMEQLFRRT